MRRRGVDSLEPGNGQGAGALAGLKIKYVFDGEDGIEDGISYMDYSGTIFLPPDVTVQCGAE